MAWVRRSVAWGLYALILLPWASTAHAGLIGITGGDGVESVIYELDPTTGAVIRQIGSTHLSNVGGMALHPITGQLYLHQNVLPTDAGLLHRFDLQTLTTTLLGPTHLSADDLAFDGQGNLYGWMVFHDGLHFSNSIIDELVQFDLSTGQATIRGSSDLLMFDNGLSFDSNGRLLIKGVDGIDLGNGSFEYHSEIYALDPPTANKTHVVRLTDAISGLDVFPSDVLAMNGINEAFTIQRNYDLSDPFNPLFQTAFLQRIDLQTGAVSTIGGNLGLPITALAFTSTAAAVPEPTTIALLAIVAVCGSVPTVARRWIRSHRRQTVDSLFLNPSTAWQR